MSRFLFLVRTLTETWHTGVSAFRFPSQAVFAFPKYHLDWTKVTTGYFSSGLLQIMPSQSIFARLGASCAPQKSGAIRRPTSRRRPFLCRSTPPLPPDNPSWVKHPAGPLLKLALWERRCRGLCSASSPVLDLFFQSCFSGKNLKNKLISTCLTHLKLQYIPLVSCCLHLWSKCFSVNTYLLHLLLKKKKISH